MSKQQLYINDVAVDMPAEEIKIKVESNLFADASKIMTAHSYSISLPRTMTNDAVLGNAYLPIADTGGKTTHRYLKASLYMDGIPLFEGGQAVLNKVEDKGYNINLYWGLLDLFEKIKSEGLNLCDLPSSIYWSETNAQWIYIPQYDDQVPQYNSGMTQSIYNSLDSDSKDLADVTPWILPSVQMGSVLSKAMSVYGITLNLTTEANARLANLWHPLTTRRAMAKDEKLIINGVVEMREMGSSGKYEPSFLNPIADADHPGNIQWAQLILPSSPTSFNHSATNAYIANDTTSIILGNQYASISWMRANADFKVTKVKIFGELPYQITIQIPNLDKEVNGTRQSSSDPFSFDAEITTEFSCKSGDKIINIADEWGDPPTSFGIGTLNVQVTIEDASGVQVGRPWDYVRNYPSVGIINYISEILAHIGGCVVGSVAIPNRLKIATIDEIVQSTPVSLDTYGVKSITMAFENQAQKNIYKHKENDDAGTADIADGVIYTNDTTLALERTAFDSKFKVPVQGKVLLWKVDGEKASWNNAGDYIAGNLDGTIANLGQDFMSTIDEYYQSYEQIVKHPKVIEAIVRLSVLDLIAFDFAKPLYIKQLNRSYLAKTLETESGDNYKLTLVQI